jgi:hypothetical protein
LGGEFGIVVLAGVPLARAWWANRRTALVHALAWATLAWLAWLWAALNPAAVPQYVALGLTGCAGVAVLGARRPGAAAWNAVVGGLFAVQLIPLGQDFIGTSWLNDPIWKVFLGATAAVGLVNYLPTRLGGGAAALLTACGLTLAQLHRPDPQLWRLAVVLAAVAPWLAWAAIGLRKPNLGLCDPLWWAFRDRFGFLWAQRVREQLNNAARNAGLAVELSWTGLRRPDGTTPSPEEQATTRGLLAALVQRFGV